MIALDLTETKSDARLSDFVPHKTMEARLDITVFVKVPEFMNKVESQESVLDVLLAIDRCIAHVGAITKLHDLSITPKKGVA